MALTTIDTYGIKDGAVQIDDIGTLAGNLTINDSGKLRLGTGLDLQLWHDGSHSYIDNDTGWLYVGSDNYIFQNKEFNETHARFLHDGSVELYHNNVLTFQTESDGASIIGPEGSSAFLTFKADEGDDNTDLFDIGVNNGGPFSIQNKASGSWETNIECNGNGNVELYYDGSKKLETASWGTQIHGVLATTSHVDIAADNAILKVGASADLQIYHDGSNSFISEAGTGVLKISGSAGVYINKHDNTETCAAFLHDAGCELYHNNVKKFETTADGIEVTGKIFSSSHIDLADSVKLLIGAGDDLQIYHDGSASYISDVGTHGIFIQSDGPGVYIRGKTGEDSIKALSDGAVELYFDNSKKFETTSAGITVTGGLIKDGSNDPIVSNQPSGGNAANPGLQIKNNGTINGSWRYDGRLEIGGQDGNAEIKLDPAGNIYILNDSGKLQLGTGQDLQIYHNGSHSIIKNSTGDLYIGSGFIGLYNAALNELKIAMYDNGAVNLYYDGSKKFETTSTGASITGSLGIGTGTARQLLHVNAGDSGAANIVFTNTGTGTASGDGFILGITGNEDAQLWHQENKPIRFATNNAERLRITSDGRLWLGISSWDGHASCDDLIIGDGSGHRGLTIYSGTASEGGIFFADGTSSNASYRGIVAYEHNNDAMTFRTAAAERLRIDSDGNFVIKSASNYNGEQVGKFEWWNENGAGIMAKIACEREQSSGAPGALVFSTSSNVDSSSNSGEGDIQEKLRIKSDGTVSMGKDNNPLSTTYTQTLDLRGRYVNAVGDIARLMFRNSTDSGGSSASIRARRFGDNYGTELTFYTQQYGGSSGGDGSARARITNNGATLQRVPVFGSKITYDGSTSQAKGVQGMGSVYINEFSGMSDSNDRFVAPYDGFYFLTFYTNVWKSSSGSVVLRWYKNGSNYSNSNHGTAVYHTHGGGGGWEHMSSQIVIELDANDYVQLYRDTENIRLDGNNYGTFGGFLVSAQTSAFS